MRTRSPKVALLLALLLALVPAVALAHPLGNFSINRFARLQAYADGLRVYYVIDMAEIPTFQAMPRLDADGDGAVNDAEGRAFLTAARDATLAGLTLRADGRRLPLYVVPGEESWALLPGQGGLQILRLTFTFIAPLELRSPLRIEFADANDPDRLGWREIVAVAGAGASLQESTVATTSQSDELRTYPTDMLSTPLQQRQASFLLLPGAAADQSARPAPSVPAEVGGSTDRFAALINAEQLSPALMLGALLLAMVWGAGHAMTPGHGKTVVAAYLVGARGTARHALFLGLTVTLTHTAGVFALGLITLFASRFILPERVFPWISLVSGLLVVSIGASLFVNRLRRARGQHHAHHPHPHPHPHTHDHDHSHDHEHEHPHGHHDPGHRHHHVPGDDGQPITWRGLLALGVSGGLLPCPSALVVLLSAIALGRVGFGLLLIVAFSAGLAGVLTAIGLLLVYANRLFSRLPLDGRLPQLLPVASAALVTLAGLGISLEALRSIL